MTKKIENFSKPNCKAIGAEIEKELAALGERLGLVFHYNGGMIGETEFIAKIRCELADGEAKEAFERDAFAKTCELFGLRAEDYGTEFSMRGTAYRLTGFALGRSARPLKITRLPDGNPMVCGTEIVPLIRKNTDERLAKAA